MLIKQFTDKGLAQFSYAILDENSIALIDPLRNPEPYLRFAQKNNATIVAVIETHTHADFISSHMEFYQMGAKIFSSKYTKAKYPGNNFDDGDSISLGNIKLKAINTPGHSLDSISVLLIDENNNEYAVFTGDSLFLGDVGRPDLREHTGGDMNQQKTQLAGQLYDSLRNKLMPLSDSTIVYPTHGAGSFCGKSMSSDLSGTIGQQKKENYALQNMSKEEFIKLIINDQPITPKYFLFDVQLNRQGPPFLSDTMSKIKEFKFTEFKDEIIIDTRESLQYKQGHLKNSINIPNGLKFETWLGTILSPSEKFYLVLNKHEKEEILNKIAKIGYEQSVLGYTIETSITALKEESFNSDEFNKAVDNYLIVDVREKSEAQTEKYFKNSKNIPLSELRERLSEITSQQPIAVHCAGGYRSAIGSSIISSFTKEKTYDIGENITELKKNKL